MKPRRATAAVLPYNIKTLQVTPMKLYMQPLRYYSTTVKLTNHTNETQTCCKFTGPKILLYNRKTLQITSMKPRLAAITSLKPRHATAAVLLYNRKALQITLMKPRHATDAVLLYNREAPQLTSMKPRLAANSPRRKYYSTTVKLYKSHQ